MKCHPPPRPTSSPLWRVRRRWGTPHGAPIVSDFFIWRFYMYIFMYTVYMNFAPTTREASFSWEMLTNFGTRNSPAPFSGGISDIKRKKIAVSRSAKRVWCGPSNIQVRQKRVWCADLTSEWSGRCVLLYCVTFFSYRVIPVLESPHSWIWMRVLRIASFQHGRF